MLKLKRQLTVKVCGMRDAANVAKVCKLGINKVGFIFHPSSPRYVGSSPIVSRAQTRGVHRVGVFVNAPLEGIFDLASAWALDGVQLHGAETPAYCQELARTFRGEICKVFSVDEAFSFESITPYRSLVSLVLFDTKGIAPGGNGVPFQWEMLHQYPHTIPFMLAGGLNVRTVADVKQLLGISQFAGIDLNSGVEVSPGVKDPQLVSDVMKMVRHDLRR